MNIKRFVKSLWEWVKTGLIAVAAAILINAFVLQAFQVKGESMLPTLEHMDSTFAFKLQSDYDYGDIVIIDSRLHEDRRWYEGILEHPLLTRFIGEEREYLWVKRVIGKAGDILELKDGEVYRNGVKLEEPYLFEPMKMWSEERIEVPEGHIFVMGDNRNHSTDSRRIGSIPLEKVIGKVIFSY